MVNHGTRGHSRVGASSASRWMACPGSVKNLKDNPMPSGAAANDGTKTHELSEAILLARLEGKVSPPTDSIEPDRLDRINYYVDKVLEIRQEVMDELDFDEELDEVQHSIETGFHLANLHKDLYGTNDAALYWNGILHVIDLKDGRGVVEAEHNPQLMYYALGVAYALDVHLEIKEVHLHIVQPKLDGDERHKRWQPTGAEMKAFVGDLIVAVRDVETKPDHCVVGKVQCTWCNTATCVKYKEEQKSQALVAFDDNDAELLDSLDGDETDRLVKLVELEDRFETIFKSARATLEQRALGGESVPGHKLIRKQGNRAWAKPEADLITELTKAGCSEDDIVVTTRTLKSPAQVEKLVEGKPKERKAIVDKLVERADKGLHLVPNSASGEPVTLGPAFNDDGIDGLE